MAEADHDAGEAQEPNGADRGVDPEADGGRKPGASRRPGHPPGHDFTFSDGLAMAVALPAWLLLFLLGTTIDSSPYRDYFLPPEAEEVVEGEPGAEPSEASSGAGGWADEATQEAATDGASAGEVPGVPALGSPEDMHYLVLLLLIFLTYTVTNVPLLCCAASVLGGLARKATIAGEKPGEDPIDLSHPVASGLMRGIFVYLFLVSGLLVIVESPFDGLTPSQYVRFGGAASLLGFLLSHNPEMARALIERANEVFHNRTRSGDDESKNGDAAT